MKSKAKRLLGEIGLWNLANAICIALPTAAVYLLGTEVMGWGPGYLSFFLTTAVLCTLTWGSWAALVWTENRGLRSVMRATTLLPGLLAVLAGGAGLFFVKIGPWFIWAGIIGGGVGQIAAAVGLSTYFRPLERSAAKANYLFGLAVYPIATTLLALGIGAMWYNFVTNPASGDWRDIFSIATLYVSVIATALVTTVIPAVTSNGLRKAANDLLPR